MKENINETKIKAHISYGNHTKKWWGSCGREGENHKCELALALNLKNEEKKTISIFN